MPDLKSAALFCLLLLSAGCVHDTAVRPLHNEVLRYPVAYDLAYLRTLEALQSLPGWELEIRKPTGHRITGWM